MIVLRPAALVDLASVVALDRSVRVAPDQPSHAADWLEPDAESHIRNWIVAGECVVAETAGELAGYAVMHYHFFHSGLIDMVIVGQRASAAAALAAVWSGIWRRYAPARRCGYPPISPTRRCNASSPPKVFRCAASSKGSTQAIRN
jgi:hypothetical protein